jgi:catalase
MICHSTPFFPAQTGEQFLAFFRAIATTGPDSPHPTPVEQFLGAHPAALAFVQAPKPAPTSYATDQYWGVNAFKLVDAEGKGTFVKWSLVPDAGVDKVEASILKDKDPDYLQKELPERLAAGHIGFKLVAQIAEEGDNTTDATVHWPESRRIVELGTLKLDAVVPDNEKESKYIIFDPIPRVEGVEPSEDPLLEMRAAVYLLSGKQRRAA